MRIPSNHCPRTLRRYTIEQCLDPILDVSASTVDRLIDEARRLPQIRHHEPRVVPRLAVPEADDFSLDHHPALVAPRARGVADVGVDVRGLATDLALRAGRGGPYRLDS